MQQDAEFQQTAERLARLGQGAITREERRQRQRSLDKMGVPGFGTKLKVRRNRGKAPAFNEAAAKARLPRSGSDGAV